MAKRNKQEKNRSKAKNKSAPKPEHSVDLYHTLHEAYHSDLRGERWGRSHDDYGFPLLMRDGVCAAEPDMGYAAGIVIDSLPESLKDKDVLDIGCGTGVISIAAAYRGANVIAADYSPKAINLTQENLAENPRVKDRVLVTLSNVFDGVRAELPDQKFDFVLANLWFPIARRGFEDSHRESIACYRRYLAGVRDLLKPDGIACLTSGAAADTQSTLRLMAEADITAHRKTVQKNHFSGQVAMNWHLYSFNKAGQPASFRDCPTRSVVSPAPPAGQSGPNPLRRA